MQAQILTVNITVKLDDNGHVRFIYGGGSAATPVTKEGDIDLCGVSGPVRLVFNLETKHLIIGGETVFLCFAQCDSLWIAREPNKPAGISSDGEFLDFQNRGAGTEPLRTVSVVDRKRTRFNYQYTLRVVGVSESSARWYEDDPRILHEPP